MEEIGQLMSDKLGTYFQGILQIGRIRERSIELWEARGCPQLTHDEEDELWELAKAQIIKEEGSQIEPSSKS